MTPDLPALYAVIEATWPAATRRVVGAWDIREGQGGGKRVSAATARQPVTADKLPGAEDAMLALGQTPLFLIRAGDEALDELLESQGYDIVDPVNIYCASVGTLTEEYPPRISSYNIWLPMAIQRDIWAAGGIGQGRIAVMERAAFPKTSLFGRSHNRPAATGFAAIHKGIAMVHALEVLARHRREGMGRYLMQEAAFWAAGHGATHISALCTAANKASNGLFTSLGMALVGHYHYRQKGSDA